METPFIPISDIFRPFTSYHGETSFDDIEEQEFEYRLDEIKPPEGFEYCLDDYSFLDDMRRECADLFLKTWKKEFEPAFKRYGYTAKTSQWYTPREYNFKHDSLDIIFDFDGFHEENKETLKPDITHYIEKVREKSRDGYTSFEPSELSSVEIDDSVIFYAIAKKEGLLDDLSEYFDDLLFEEFREIASEYYSEAVHKLLEGQPWYKKQMDDIKTKSLNLCLF